MRSNKEKVNEEVGKVTSQSVSSQSFSTRLTRCCRYEMEMINFCALGRGRGVGVFGVGWGGWGIAQRLHTEGQVRDRCWPREQFRKRQVGPAEEKKI